MQIPAKRVCDLCQSELTGAFVIMSYPLDTADREPLAAAFQASMPEPFRMLGQLMDATPSSWRFDFCRGCADGFMPMLADLKTAAVKRWLAEQARETETSTRDRPE